MATGGLYGNASESVGLYGNTTNFGGTYFEWFIFQESATQPATPTGGSWDFLTNIGVPPTGWSSTPPVSPTNTVWASIAIVNSRSNTAFVWSTPASWIKPGAPGTAATVNAGTTTTGAPGTSASVTNSGTTSAAVFNFVIPRGDTGATGPAGTPGTPGAAATVTTGTTTTGAAGTSASVTNSGTTSAAVLNFTIPRGDTGATGPAGSAATIAAGTTTTLSPGSSATVTNAGTSSAAVFNFGIPQGTAGAAATIAAGTTTTLSAGSSATVTNSGTSSAAVFNFGIPQGATGATGATGAQGVPGINWLGTWSSSTAYAIRDAVTYNGTSYYAIAANTNQAPPNATYWNVLAQKGADGTGAVSSVGLSAPALFTVSGSPVTSSGTLALSYSGSALPIANGGTNATTAAGALTSLGALGSATSSDGSIVVNQVGTNIDLTVSAASPASTLLTQVRNTTGATLTKGTVVYISGATGQIATVSKALATSDATSAQTLGMMTADLANNSNGYVTVIGLLENMDTSAYTDGQQLYLSGTTAGAVTATKPYAPIHLVYVAVVEYAHPTQGKLFVKVQNGYELDEIHNVSAQTPTNGQTIVYNSATGLWTQNTVSLTAGVNGTLPVANGGTGVTTSTGSGSVVLSTSPTLVTPALGTPASGNFSTGAFTWPTFNQNTTGTAANVTGTVAIANGGTGQTTQAAAITALTGTQTNAYYLRSNGTNATLSALSAADLTGTVAVATGGTGLTTAPTNGQVLIGNGSGYTLSGLTAGSGISVTNASGSITIANTQTPGASTSAANTWTATQTFSGSTSTFGTSLLDSNEIVNVVAAAPSATTNFYVQSGSVQYYTSNAANNWTLNIAFSSGTSMNTALATGQSVTFTLVTTQGSTAYYNNAVTIDGTSVTPKWIGGAPTAGNASGLDVYRYAVIKTASATYTVLASLTQYK